MAIKSHLQQVAQSDRYVTTAFPKTDGLKIPLTPFRRLKPAAACMCGLTVVVRRAEGVVSHAPTRWKDDKVGDGHTWSGGFGGQDREDGGIL